MKARPPLEKVLAGNFEWARLVDPDAGRVDDILIASSKQLDAYQVKWAAVKSTYTFASVTKANDEAPALWNQLAQGWNGLRKIHPDRSVHVHLLTNEIASPNDSLPGNDGADKTHFQDLWSSVLGVGPLPRKVVVEQRFVGAIKALESSSGLNHSDFADFLANSRLQFDYRNPRDFDSESHVAAVRFQQIADLAGLLQRSVAQSKGIAVTLTLSELTEQLEWLRHSGNRFNQNFPVDESSYRPIQPTVDQIADAMEAGTKGYFALLGAFAYLRNTNKKLERCGRP